MTEIVRCDECNDDLEVVVEHHGVSYVKPCKTCLEKAKAEGVEDGKEEGYDDGFDVGYEAGRSA